MPLYDYKCDRCGYEVKLIVPNWEDATAPKTTMPHHECGGLLVRAMPVPKVRP